MQPRVVIAILPLASAASQRDGLTAGPGQSIRMRNLAIALPHRLAGFEEIRGGAYIGFCIMMGLAARNASTVVQVWEGGIAMVWRVYNYHLARTTKIIPRCTEDHGEFYLPASLICGDFTMGAVACRSWSRSRCDGSPCLSPPRSDQYFCAKLSHVQGRC